MRTPSGPELSDAFQEQAQTLLSYAAHPLYALVHESIYGQDARPTAWAAERVRAEFPQFDAAKALAGDGPVLFTGETVHPWMFETDPALRPLRETAGLLAARTDWRPLYDPARLAANEVPVAAAVYHDDMYVDATHSLQTAAAVRGLRPWVTNEYEHDGLRTAPGSWTGCCPWSATRCDGRTGSSCRSVGWSSCRRRQQTPPTCGATAHSASGCAASPCPSPAPPTSR